MRGNIQLDPEEILMSELCEKIRECFGEFLTDEEMDFLIETSEWYAEKKVKIELERKVNHDII